MVGFLSVLSVLTVCKRNSCMYTYLLHKNSYKVASKKSNCLQFINNGLLQSSTSINFLTAFELIFNLNLRDAQQRDISIRIPHPITQNMWKGTLYNAGAISQSADGYTTTYPVLLLNGHRRSPMASLLQSVNLRQKQVGFSKFFSLLANVLSKHAFRFCTFAPVNE